MTILTRLRSLFRTMFRKEELNADLDAELRSYLDMLVDEKIAAGMSPEEAHRQARRELGGMDQVKSAVRGRRVGARLETLLQDLRFAARSLSKSWTFSLVAIATLGLGIGANTAIFSVLNGVILRPLPYERPDRIVTLWHRALDGSYDQSTTTPANFYAWKAGATQSFTSMAAYATTARTLSGRGEPERVIGLISVGSVFDVLGVPAALGRTFGDAEDRPGAEPVVVIGHGLRDRVFGSGTDPVGETLDLNGTLYTVIGVMRPGFSFPSEPVEYWIPAGFPEEFRGSRDQYFLRGLARLANGVTAEAADAELETVMARLRADYPQGNDNVATAIVPPTRPSSAAYAPGSSSSWAPWASSCSSPAPTSPTSFSREPRGGTRRSRCGRRWVRPAGG